MSQEWSCPYDHRNPLVRSYFRRIASKAVKFLNLRDGDFLLDFGCGKKKFKGFLDAEKRKFRYVGFDIVPELSDLKDYTKTNPDKVACIHVMEHMTKKEIDAFVDYLVNKKIGMLVVALPTENWLSKAGIFLFQKNVGHVDHFLRYREIHNILKERLLLVRSANIFTMTVVSEWKPKSVIAPGHYAEPR
jgi:cyclopropane fatty-acyl-phospholipid synthase-like methyltransferase